MNTDPLLLGLKLYEPKTFLFLSNYLTSLQLQTQTSALVTAGAALALVLFGLPFRRVSAVITLTGLLWTTAGVAAMALHQNFPVFTIVAGIVGLAVGAVYPRLAHAIVAAALLSLIVRAIVSFVDPAFAVYGVLGGALVGFVVALLAWESWVALCTSAVGAVVIAYSLSALLGSRVAIFSLAARDEWAALYGAIAAFFFLVGLVVQLRTGEITWPRAQQWRLFRFLAKIFKRKPKPAAKPKPKPVAKT